MRDKILEPGKKATEAIGYFWGNITQGVQDATKVLLIVQNEVPPAYIELVKTSLAVTFCVEHYALFQQVVRRSML